MQVTGSRSSLVLYIFSIYFEIFGDAFRSGLAVPLRGRWCRGKLAPRRRRSMLAIAILVLHAISLRISFAISVGEVVAVLFTAAVLLTSAAFASNARMLD